MVFFQKAQVRPIRLHHPLACKVKLRSARTFYRRIGCIFLLQLIALIPLGAFAEITYPTDEWRQSIARDNAPYVVSVLPQIGGNQINKDEPEGTGVSIGRYVVTADHVLGNANRILLRDGQGNVTEAQIYLRDSARDLALLEPASMLPSLSMSAVNSNFGVGSDVCVLGNAFGLGITLTCGIVSGIGQRGIGFNFIEDFVQIDAAVNPGMSGGPIFDSHGQLRGIVTAIFTKRSDGNLGVNFAVSQRLLDAFLQDAEDGIIDRPKAGMVLQNAPLPGEIGQAGGLVKVIQASSAEAIAGMQVGDLLISANDIKIRGQADYITALALAGTNANIKLHVIRNDVATEITFITE